MGDEPLLELMGIPAVRERMAAIRGPIARAYDGWAAGNGMELVAFYVGPALYLEGDTASLAAFIRGTFRGPDGRCLDVDSRLSPAAIRAGTCEPGIVAGMVLRGVREAIRTGKSRSSRSSG